MSLNFDCVSALAEHLSAKFAGDRHADTLDIPVEPCPADMDGDITINCFRLAKPLRSNPMEIAKTTAEFLGTRSDVTAVFVVKAFVNVEMTAASIHGGSLERLDELLDSAKIADGEKKRILVEYSAPNTNKPQHLGHVRNNTLGMALVSLLKRIGHDVIPVNLVNDRGIHICKSMTAYRRYGDGATPESTGKKGDHLVGDFYVKFDQELKKELETLRKSRPELKDKNDDELFNETSIGAEASQMLRDWESGDREVRELWEMMNSWVFAGFAETYKRMGVEFVRTYLESETYLLGKDIVEEGLKSGAFTKRPDGATIADLGKKMGEKVVLRSDGTSVYITQDIGTTLKKREDYNPDVQVWVVGDEQKFHFQVLFAIIRKLGHSWADDLHHLAYGMVNLPSGKMKSREGTVVDADDLFDEMHNLAREATLERSGDNVPEDLEERSEMIGMGALKFMLLKFNPKTTIMFNPEESLKFEGDTGPYVQYSCARINSILRKAGLDSEESSGGDIDWGLLDSEYEKALSIRAYQYPSVLKRAGELMDCSGIVNFLLDLAKDFNRFYRECPVISAENEQLKRARLELSRRVRAILADGLATLTISVPNAM
jgi:arginyl-tRNA synthetase